MHLKTKRKRIKVSIIIILILAFILTLFIKIENNIKEILLNYADSEIRKIVSITINNALDDDTLKSINRDNLYTITKNKNDEIELIDYNSITVNIFLKNITSTIEKNLLKLDANDYRNIGKNSNILFYIPLGVLLNSPLFNNIGPKIPVRVQLVSSVLTNINTNIKEYGINNALIEMTLHVEVRAKILLPISTKEILITNEVPISYKIIKGSIPNYYGEGLNSSSKIFSIPIE